MGRAEKRIGQLVSAAALAALLVILSSGAALAQTPAIPIPSINRPPAPTYIGNPATPNPIGAVHATPQNPFMATNGVSEIHDDEWQSDVNFWNGPLGNHPQVLSSDLRRECASITFDRQGRVLSICVGGSGPELYMFDPNTLATLATFMLPPRSTSQDYAGGGYFYLDNNDEVVTPTSTQHIWVIGETPGSPGFTLVHDYSLTSVLTSSESIGSVLPDPSGLLWFVAKTDGVVGTLNLTTGVAHVMRLGSGSDGEIENSFAIDQHGGVYIATNRKLYRFGAGRGGAPKIIWQISYPNSFEHKPGQVDDGTGSTPTVMPGGYVNIVDNADPMHIMVYRTAAHPHKFVYRHHRRRRIRLPRQVCRMSVFSKGASADENSLIGAGRIMIAEDNYGYTGPASVEGRNTVPGFVRIDLNSKGNGCHRVWLNTTDSAPTVVSKMSISDGLIYTYTTDGSGHWYWTALDYRTGQAVYKVLAGTGVAFNNNYAGIAISPSGTEYLGVLAGIVALRDG